MSSNSFWNIANFRGRLIGALVAQGYRLVVAVPGVDQAWASTRHVEAADLPIDRSGLNPFTDAKLWLHYVGLFRRYRPSAYLSFTAKPNIYGSLAAQISGTVSIPNVSGLGTAFMNDGLLCRFVGLLYRLAFRRCPIVFFQNPDDRALFIARRIVRQDQARLLPGSGIDLDHFQPAPPPEDEDPRFLFIGRLLGDKGVRDFVEAARMLRRRFPRWRFQLLGDPDPDNRSGIGSDEVRRWVDQGLVEHLGHADDVRPHIAASTAVVLPSYREGLPRSLLEAAAMARPLVATDVPGCRELVTQGETGFRCNVRDPASLAMAMQQVGTMPAEVRLAMGMAARALAEREYDVELVVKAYLEALAQLTGRAGV